MDDHFRRAVDAVSERRLAERLGALARIGGTDAGGITRLALTAEERAAQGLVASWLEPLGYDARRDDAGNLLCRHGGEPTLLVGSHLDTVPEGGAFDGALGVVVAAEVAEALAAGAIDAWLTVVAWMGEEGPRFGVGLFGSATATGLLHGDAWSRADTSGTTAREAAAALLGREPDLSAARIDPSTVRAYLEVHMEQSEDLAEAGVPLAVVSAIVGLTHARVTVEGRADHAGATAMRDRRDALTAASEMILAVERIAREADGRAIATVGEVHVVPNAPNVVPGRCRFSLDVRAPEDAARADALGKIRAVVDEVAVRRGVQARLEELESPLATPMDPRVMDVIRSACKDVGVSPLVLPSRAGHDAQNLARAGIPTGMLFARSTHGSHRPDEHVDPGDAALAARAAVVACARLAATAG